MKHRHVVKDTTPIVQGKTLWTWYLETFAHLMVRPDKAFRVPEQVARDLLTANLPVKGRFWVRYIQMKNIGLDVYELTLRPQGEIGTIIVTA